MTLISIQEFLNGDSCWYQYAVIFANRAMPIWFLYTCKARMLTAGCKSQELTCF